MGKLKLILATVPVVLILAAAVFPMTVNAAPLLTANAAPPSNNTGLTVKIVAHSGQTISGPVNATGFDIGVYIGPGVRHVTVTGAMISGAHDEGILVQDTSGIVIKNNTISNNALTGSHGGLTPPALTEDKAIVLAGTTDCRVENNVVENNGHGGISVLDDGPNHPFALNTVASTQISGTENVVTGNTIVDNAGDCGIVVAAKNPGAGVSHGVNDNTISNNRVIADPGAVPPYVGGIVVAGGAGQTSEVYVTNNKILNNVVVGGLIPGISIHVFGPKGFVSDTQLIGNVISNNGVGESSGNTTGIEIFAVPGGVIKDTQVQSDTVISDYYGVWHVGDSGTTISGLLPYAVPVLTFP